MQLHKEAVDQLHMPCSSDFCATCGCIELLLPVESTCMLRLLRTTGTLAFSSWRTSAANHRARHLCRCCAYQPALRCCVTFKFSYIRLQLHKSAAASGLPGRQLRQAIAHAASAGKHRGFGFIEFEGKEDAGDAIDNMNNAELYGRTLRVNYAQPMKIKGGEKGFSHQAVWADSDNWWVPANTRSKRVYSIVVNPLRYGSVLVNPHTCWALHELCLPLFQLRLTLCHWLSRADLSRFLKSRLLLACTGLWCLTQACRPGPTVPALAGCKAMAPA